MRMVKIRAAIKPRMMPLEALIKRQRKQRDRDIKASFCKVLVVDDSSKFSAMIEMIARK